MRDSEVTVRAAHRLKGSRENRQRKGCLGLQEMQALEPARFRDAAGWIVLGNPAVLALRP
jgi:hypothetical protein